MRDCAVEVIGYERAARAAFMPIRPEHEMVNDQLTAARKEVSQRDPAVRGIENIFFVNSLPGQLPPLGGQLVVEPSELFFLHQKGPASFDPFRIRYDVVALQS